MVRLGVVRFAQSTAGNSSSHESPCFFRTLYVLVLRPLRISALARSTWPLLLRWAGELKHSLIPMSSQ